jgi:hypothetical protein
MLCNNIENCDGKSTTNPGDHSGVCSDMCRRKYNIDSQWRYRLSLEYKRKHCGTDYITR